eukprot:TRINITY_DN3107_c0_g1_i1.p2 TRINITY_DN3107_c0_g1~~TRINITY_DN3107_c0_g1_i1.p2  ORF type:complete len:455 (-),score=42.53 TRINITY_DN3107_c0_g1_i1:90-1454(-)
MSCGDLTSLPLEVLCAVFSHLGNRDLFAVLSSCAYVDDAFRGDSSQEGWFLMYQRLKGRKEAFRSLHWKLQYMQELLLRRGFLHASSITSSLMDDSDPQIIIDDESSWCWFVSENKPLIGHHLKQLSRIQLPVTPRDDVKKILTIDTFSYVIVYSSDRVSLASTLMPNVTPLCPLSYGRAFASDFIFCDTRGVWIETPSKLQNRLFEVNRFRESLKEVRGINSSESSSLFPSHVLGLHVGSVRRKMIIIGSPGLLSLWDFSNFRFCTLLELDFDISELIPGWGEAHFFVVRKENNSSHCFYHFEITCEEKEVSEERLSVFSVVKTQSINCERSLTDYKVGSHVLVGSTSDQEILVWDQSGTLQTTLHGYHTWALHKERSLILCHHPDSTCFIIFSVWGDVVRVVDFGYYFPQFIGEQVWVSHVRFVGFDIYFLVPGWDKLQGLHFKELEYVVIT